MTNQGKEPLPAGRWPLYNDCAEETRIMLARINRRLREERSTDH